MKEIRLQELAKIDEICDQFEQSLKAGKAASLDEYLSGVDVHIREKLKAELLNILQCYGNVEAIETIIANGQSNPASVETQPKQTGTDTNSSHDRNPQEGIDMSDKWIGRYRIESEINRGSFGRVLKAFDDQLERWVAIKVRLPGAFDNQSETDDFIAEARRVAKLDHSHIVPVYDAGQLDNGSCYVVSKFIQGGSLKEAIDQHSLSFMQAINVIAIIAKAAEFAHRQGFVHRDIKPANILLDESRNPYLCDFGLALHEDEQLLRPGEFSGSPAYMSPEQVRRESAHLDGRSDIWSIGVIFYQLATGKLPFRGATLDDLRDSILSHQPKPPRMVNPEVCEEMEYVILLCLEKDVRKRFQTAGDLVQAITDWIAREDRDHSVQSKTRTEQRKWPSWVWTAIVSIAVIFSLIVIMKSSPEKLTSNQIKPNDVESLPLQADLDVRIWNDHSPQRTGISIGDSGALPLQAGDQIRIEGELSEPAYPYLVWISSEGEVSPVYPWSPGDWSSRPDQESAVKRVSLPETIDEAWPITGSPGMESLLMLVRNSPLPQDVDLQSLIGQLPAQAMQKPSSVVWFVNGSPVTEDAYVSQLAENANRAPQFFNPQKVNDPVLNAQAELYEQLKDHFQLIQAAAFANAGVE